MSTKRYLTAQGLLEDSFQLGHQILQSGFEPTFIIAIWRGGVPVGIAVQEYLHFHGIHADNIAIRTSSYSGIDQQSREVRVFGLNYLVKNIEHHDRLLIVDDVFDSGNSIKAALDKIRAEARLNTPHDIRIATPYFKPNKNKTDLRPDYFVHETDEWLVFPHELKGLTKEEIREHKPWVKDWIERYL